MKLREHLTEIKTDIALIKQDLSHHIKRTELLEKDVELRTRHLERKIAPLTKIYHFLQIAGALIVLGAAITAILKALL